MTKLTIKFYGSAAARTFFAAMAETVKCEGLAGPGTYDLEASTITVQVRDMQAFGAAFRQTGAFLWSDFNADGRSSLGRT